MSWLRNGPATPPERTARRLVLVAVLGAMSAFGPLSMDFYLPAMPQLAADLEADDALAQATMATCIVGLAVGQLFVGPWSDRVGRRIPLLFGVGLFAVTSALCAFVPTIEVMLVVRFVQGLAGAAGLVVARAIVRDLYSGAAAARTFSHLMLVIGIAPVVAPIAGGALLVWMDWRGLFLVLGVVGVVLFALALFLVPDTLHESRRESGFSQLGRQLIGMLRNRQFVCYVIAMGANQAILFSFVQMASLIYQEDFGLDPQVFSIVFAVNAVGMIITSQSNGALVGRFQPRSLLMVSLTGAVIGSSLVVVTGALALPFIVIAVCVLLTTSMHGVSMPNINALALEPFAKGAGLAAAVLGGMQFFFGGVIPIVAAAAGLSVVTMGLTMGICAVVALSMVLLARREEPATA